MSDIERILKERLGPQLKFGEEAELAARFNLKSNDK